MSYMYSNNTTILFGFTEPSYTIFGVLFTLIILFTISGNVLVLVAVLRSQRLMQSVTSYFVCSLACADLLIGLVVMPLTSMQILKGTWLFGRQMCDFRYMIDAVSVTASINSLCAISIDRYLAVTSPLRYSSLLTRSRARVFTITIWIIAIGVAISLVYLGWNRSGDGVHRHCLDNPQCCTVQATKTFAVLSSLFAFYLPLIIMIFLYARILKEANTQVEKLNKHASKSISSNDRRALKTLALILGVFIICWFPFFTIYPILSFCQKCITDNQFYIIIWVGYINSACNPLLYTRSPDFMAAYIRLFRVTLARNT